MADNQPKSSIPAWQKAKQPEAENNDVHQKDDGKENAVVPAEAKKESTKDIQSPTPSDARTPSSDEKSPSGEWGPETNVANMKAFLQDPSVKDAPIQKKRAFFESKGIPVETIDQVLGRDQPTFTASDLSAFQTRPSQPASRPSPPQQQQQQPPRPSTPPIITYPEFLVDAHKPPPLITPTRLLNTAYLAGGLTALLYGASHFLVQPMSATLTDARHDFSTHTGSKLDELNERLIALVSKIPTAAKTPTPYSDDPDDDDDAANSDTSDPTELYHRDMGTQTSAPPSPGSSSPSSLAAADPPAPAIRHITALTILSSHLTDMATRSDALGATNQTRQDSMKQLQHAVDMMMYSKAYGGSWGLEGVGGGKGEEGKRDEVEELKRQIRAVKGVLLSAKRFPSVGMGGRGATVGVGAS